MVENPLYCIKSNYMEKMNLNQAAFLYLLLFNIGEAGDEKHDQLEIDVKLLLGENGFPDEVLFDNEGEPMIIWAAFVLPHDDEWDWDKFLMGDELNMEQLLRPEIFKRLTMLLDEPYQGKEQLIDIVRYWDTHPYNN